MEWTDGPIEGVEIRRPQPHTDARGWLSEVYRSDEVDPEIMPAMGYVSVSHPGITRGPHEHRDQTDMIGFFGPGDLRIRLWDNRSESPTYGRRVTLIAGQTEHAILVIPPGVVHAYTNISEHDGWQMNFPNRLFAGQGKQQPIDEIRHENMPNSPFVMED
jgi:dTDP-4-dehydrorhamnose 3,5-epimerase